MEHPVTMSRRAERRDALAAEPPGRARLSQRALCVIYGIVAAGILVGLIALGSRGFHWFDAALIGYAVATIFSVAAVTYKYTFWLARPQTGRYFWRGWQLFLSWENFRRYTALIPRAIVSTLLAQWFIRKRATYRWVMHLCIFWGVVLSCLITFPLTFGWLRFTQLSSGFYEMWVFGFPLIAYDPYSPIGFVIFHALDFTAVLLIVGLVLAFHRRFHDLALIAVQRFRFDVIALALLLAIAVSGLALTADSAFLGGAYYWYVSLVHQAVVVLWLISLPFGKFFHILERPATVGIELYWQTGEDSTQRTCPRCGVAFAPALFIGDLKKTLAAIGQDYTVTEAAQGTPDAIPRDTASGTASRTIWWQDFCPDCKRVMRGAANLAALGRDGNQFL